MVFPPLLHKWIPNSCPGISAHFKKALCCASKEFLINHPQEQYFSSRVCTENSLAITFVMVSNSVGKKTLMGASMSLYLFLSCTTEAENHEGTEGFCTLKS